MIVSTQGGALIVGDGVAFRATEAPCELLVHPGARLQIDGCTFIKYGSSIAAAGSVSIGKNCLIGHYCAIMDTEHHGVLDRSQAHGTADRAAYSLSCVPPSRRLACTRLILPIRE